MSDRIDYRYNAEKRAALAITTADPTDARIIAQIATAEATLALVEQQRIANLIAYATLLELQYAEAAKHSTEFDWTTRTESEQRHARALELIREGLGL